MLKKERQAFILHNINLHNRVLVNDLSNSMAVSEDTIRRDLQELADKNLVIKVHGGALSAAFQQNFNAAAVYAIDVKKAIAKKAVSLIENGMVVLTSGGTTIVEMAKALPPQLQATFITCSVLAAQTYMQHPNIEVVFIGGKFSKTSQITVGANAIQTIKEIKADICFLGINALDIANGITDNDWEVVQVKKAMLGATSNNIALSISEKLNTMQRLKVCNRNDITTLITELEPTHTLLKPYKKIGLQIL